MKRSFTSTLVLITICVAVALLLAITNNITSPIIAEKEAEAVNEALLLVMPDGIEFTRLDVNGHALPETVTEVYLAKNGGFVFKLVTSGYSSGLSILCGVNPDGTVSGSTCIASGETLGHEYSFGKSLNGRNYGNVDSVDTVAGATKTTKAYRNAIKDALSAAEMLKETDWEVGE
jgi:electron transport complex protein RnfG